MTSSRPRSPTTALWLSLLVGPGIGHWYLGHKWLGSLFAAATTIASLYPLVQFARSVEENMATAMLTEPVLRLSTALRTAWQANEPLIVLGVVVVVGLWIVAACDVYRRTNQGRTR